MKYDRRWGALLADPARFADAINGFGCNGEQVVTAEDLQEADTQLRGFPLPKFVRGFSKGSTWSKPKIRDMVRKVAFGVNFAIIGLENQSTTDYSLPLRNMLYDVAEYEKQAVKVRKQTRKNAKDLSPGEYLYGFQKDSKLFPVVTFVLYDGEEEWQGPTNLHQMLDFTDIPDSLRKMIPNYEINIIPIRKIKDTSIFKSDLRYLFEFLKYTSEPEKMKQLVESEPFYSCVDEEIYDVMSSYVNIDKMDVIKEEYIQERKVDMCKGIQGWVDMDVEKKVAERMEQIEKQMAEQVAERVEKQVAERVEKRVIEERQKSAAEILKLKERIKELESMK